MEEVGSDEQNSGEGLTVSGSTDGQDWFNPTAKILLSCSPLFMLPSPDQLARCSADRKGPTHVFRAREGGNRQPEVERGLQIRPKRLSLNWSAQLWQIEAQL